MSCFRSGREKSTARTTVHIREAKPTAASMATSPSCHSCKYCTPKRDSDFTVGDFWGIEEVRPGFDDGMGCSAVLCRTEAGEALWRRVCRETEWFVCGVEEIANDSQPRLREPTAERPGRGACMALWRLLPFSLWLRLFRRLCPPLFC